MAEGRVRERWKDGGETEVHVEETGGMGCPAEVSARLHRLQPMAGHGRTSRV